MIAPAFGSALTSLPQLGQESPFIPTSLLSLTFSYFMTCAVMTTPPLNKHSSGPIILCCSVFVFSSTASYVVTSTFLRLRSSLYVEQACECGGMITQVATLLGAGLAAMMVSTGIVSGEL